MFLHYVLTRQKTELIYQFLMTMIRKPTKGDWVEVVKEDLQDLDIRDSFEELGQYKTEDLKKKVKEASKKYSLETLKRGIKKKGANLKYEKLAEDAA